MAAPFALEATSSAFAAPYAARDGVGESRMASRACRRGKDASGGQAGAKQRFTKPGLPTACQQQLRQADGEPILDEAV